jgi:predicted nucleic acid-binding protein
LFQAPLGEPFRLVGVEDRAVGNDYVHNRDPADNKIIECAVTAGSDYIVTGDKDLLRLGQYDAIRIVNVADFLNVARGPGRVP